MGQKEATAKPTERRPPGCKIDIIEMELCVVSVRKEWLCPGGRPRLNPEQETRRGATELFFWSQGAVESAYHLRIYIWEKLLWKLRRSAPQNYPAPPTSRLPPSPSAPSASLSYMATRSLTGIAALLSYAEGHVHQQVPASRQYSRSLDFHNST